MYRSYEDPFSLEDRLEELRAEYSREVEEGADEERLISLACDIEEMCDRIRFAWDDDEFDSEW